MAAAIEKLHATEAKTMAHTPRSESFAQPAKANIATKSRPPADSSGTLGRNEDLTVIEDLEPGPVDHSHPFDDPHFDRIEPNSRINLK